MTGQTRWYRRDEGFTLVELMVAMALGGIILAAALKIFVDGMNASAAIQDRSEAAQRARIGFDRATQLLNSQVCNAGVKPIVSGTSTSVRFTGNLGAVDATPTGYELVYEAATRRLWENRYTLVAGTGGNPATWPSSPVVRRMIGDSLYPVSGANVFRYYGENSQQGGSPTEFSSPLTATTLGRVLRVDLTLKSVPTRTKNPSDRTSAVMQTRSYVTSNIVDTDLDQGPQC